MIPGRRDSQIITESVQNSLKNHNARMSLNNLARVILGIPFSASAYTGLSHFLAVSIDTLLAQLGVPRTATLFRFPFSFLFGRPLQRARAKMGRAFIARPNRPDISRGHSATPFRAAVIILFD